MTHSKRLLILLYISIWLQQPSCAFDPTEVAESFFNYTLCLRNSDGLKWACLIPNVEGGDPTKLVGEEYKLNMLEAADSMLAIQQQTDQRWRVIMQIRGAVKLEKGVSLGVENGPLKTPVACEIHGKTVAEELKDKDVVFDIKKGIGYGYGRYDVAKQMLMCEFTIQSYNDHSLSDKEKGIKGLIKLMYHDSQGNQIIKSMKHFGVLGFLEHRNKDTCRLDLEYVEPHPQPGDEVYRRYNTDRKLITCPAGYSMRVRDRPSGGGTADRTRATFVTVLKMECGVDLRVTYDVSGSNSETKTVRQHMHCAKRICTLCDRTPPCEKKNKATDKCPYLGVSSGYESCIKLKCQADKFVINAVAQIRSPECGGNNTWMFGGAVVTDAVCGDKLTCKPPNEAISLKDKMDLFDIMPNLVTCKDNISMSYTPKEDKQDEVVKLQRIYCNSTDGKWYEAAGMLYQQEHKLECKAESKPAVVGARTTFIMVGVGAGLLALIIVVILVAWCCCGRKKKKRSTESALKHKLATKTTTQSKSKSNVGSGSGSGGKKSGGRTNHDASAPPSFTQKFPEDEDKDRSKGRIPKPEEDAKEAEAKKKAQALLESSKIHDDDADNDQERQAQIARVKEAMKAAPAPAAPKKGSGQAQKKKQAPERAEDEQQEQPDQSEKGGAAAQDDALLDINRRAPQRVVEKTQFETSPYQMNVIPGLEDLPPAPTQEPEQPAEPEAPSAPRTPIKDRPSKKKTTVTAETQIQDEDSVAKTPQADEAAKKDEEPAKPAAVKPKDTVADMPTAKKKEESAKKKNSKKEPAAPVLNEKEKAGARRIDHKADVLSDYESEPKDKVSSRSSKKKLVGGRRVRDEPSRKPDATQHTHVHGSEAGCGPLCMPMPRSHTDESKDD